MRDLAICLLSSLNILIFSFILLNAQAFEMVDAFENPQPSENNSFEHVTHQIQQNLIKNQWNRAKKIHRTGAINRVSLETATLSIPRINLLTPIVFHESLSSEEAQRKLEQGAISLKPFIPPSKSGQTIIFGHSSDYPWRKNEYATLFTLLPKLELGDIITISNGQKNFRYEVDRTLITDTGLSGLIQNSPTGNELILTTCYPIGFFSKRFNVVAMPVTSAE